MTTEPTPPVESDPIGRELMRQAQLIAQLRHDLDELAHSITDIAADVLARLEELDTQEPARRTTPQLSWCWRDLGPEAAKELWAQVTDWVDWLRSRYPLAKKIPPCWPQHPEVVEELTALWLAWQAAYADPSAGLTTAAEWHDRWLPGLVHRLTHGTNALECTIQHVDRPSSVYSRPSA